MLGNKIAAQEAFRMDLILTSPKQDAEEEYLISGKIFNSILSTECYFNLNVKLIIIKYLNNMAKGKAMINHFLRQEF